MHKKTYFTLIFAILFSVVSFGQQKLENGTIVPNIISKTHDGTEINLYSMLEKSPVVIVFYRGQWCHYCNKYMNDLQDSLSFIEKAGAQIIAITPENNENIDKTIEKSGANFNIIYDKGHKIMDSYKVTWNMSNAQNTVYKIVGININKASGNSDKALPVPATYVVSTDKKVAGGYFNTDYKKRMPVSDILEVLKSID